MEGELFCALYDIVQQEAKLRSRAKGVCFSDVVIVLIFFWAVLHDRPICWACRRINWTREWAWLSLPSTATMSRRLKTLSCLMLIAALYHRLQAREESLCCCRRIDSKPLVVGGFSKDRDARRGYATGGLARGYKLSVAWGHRVVPDTLIVAALNVSDQQCAIKLIDHLAEQNATGYLLADATHDTNPTHQHAADKGFQLLAPRKKPGTGLGHSGHSPARLRSIELLEGPGPFGGEIYSLRAPIERSFGRLCSFGGGLQPLPSWVRRPRRVARWVIAKLIISGILELQSHGLAA